MIHDEARSAAALMFGRMMSKILQFADLLFRKMFRLAVVGTMLHVFCDFSPLFVGRRETREGVTIGRSSVALEAILRRL